MDNCQLAVLLLKALHLALSRYIVGTKIEESQKVVLVRLRLLSVLLSAVSIGSPHAVRRAVAAVSAAIDNGG